MRQNCLIRDVALGLVAGAIATLLMDKVSTWGYKLEDSKVRDYEEKLRGGDYPPEVLAKRAVELTTGATPTKETAQKAGMAIHWGYGILWGGLFGALRNRVLGVGSAGGVIYGLGLWLMGDELMMPILKLSPPSTEFPWQNHARAMTNHVAYGTTLALTDRVLRKLANRLFSL